MVEFHCTHQWPHLLHNNRQLKNQIALCGWYGTDKKPTVKNPASNRLQTKIVSKGTGELTQS